MGRRAAGGAARGGRRGDRDGALPPLRRRVPGRRTATTCSPRSAIADVQRIEALDGDEALDLSLYRPLGGAARRAALQALPARRARVAVRRAADVREPGLDGDRRAALRGHAARRRAGVDLRLRAAAPASEVDVDAIRERFHEGFARVWHGEAEQDGFNGLILGAGLDWREVTMLRAVARYLRQAGIPFSDRYMEQTLLAHTERRGARWCELFHARFDPGGRPRRRRGRGARPRSRRRSTPSTASTRTASCAASSASCARCCARTTSWPDPKPYVSFKLDPTQIPLVPAAAAALRDLRALAAGRGRAPARRRRSPAAACAGRDRREDFRTEILGLMKAQMVKNALIVPVGAKGGFVVKRRRATTGRRLLHDVHQRPARHHRHDSRPARSCRPRDVVRHDGDDPYLVVAADKGTATFSDIANGDRAGATASGSATRSRPAARSATTTRRWASRRAAPGCRCSATSASSASTSRARTSRVVGIGDMSGDVFGNGMLLSRAHPARGRVRPPPHLPRPGPRRGGLARRAAAAVRAAALLVGGLRHAR